MPTFTCDYDLCTGCGTCVFVCPKNLIALEDRHPVMDEDKSVKCTSCGQCVAYCPEGAAHQSISEGEQLEPAMAYNVRNIPIVDGILKSRRSYRNFARRPVSQAIIDQILEVAHLAPSGRNVRFLRWVVLNNPAKVGTFIRLAKTWFDSIKNEKNAFTERYPVAPMLDVLSRGKDPFFCGAPAAVFIVGDKNQRWGEIDSAIAGTYFNLAAEARNIGCCFAGRATNIAQACPEIRDYLGVKENEEVYIGLFFGHKTVQSHTVPGRGPVPVTYL